VPSDAVVVVLPTPPFWLAIAKIFDMVFKFIWFGMQI
jgi:hypothetical protein